MAGSADAAGALVACNAVWGLGCSNAELAEIAAELGSGRAVQSAWRYGTGCLTAVEVLTPVPGNRHVHVGGGDLVHDVVHAGGLRGVRPDERRAHIPAPKVPQVPAGRVAERRSDNLGQNLHNDLQQTGHRHCARNRSAARGRP